MNYDAFKTKFNLTLNPQQERAVRKAEGPALLLAVPGSGKTTVIVARIGYMLFCAGIKPENILTLTFSRAAASEMKERFCVKFGAEAAAGLHFSTIHSFCLSVIRKCEAQYGIHVPQLAADNGRIIRKVFLNMFGEYPEDIAVKELSQAIGLCKNMMYTGDRLEGIDFPDFDFRRFYDEYEAFKQNNDLMDFDDQLLFAYTVLEDHPDLLEAFQAQYRYVNVDEAQDTSFIQHKLIRKISARHENIFMVGDEDQSIYGFRAAYPGALINFGKDHPGAEIMLLETNYRCASNIAEAAGRFISRNKNRYAKNMQASRGQGRIYETRLHDARQQYRYLLNELKSDIKKGKQAAVLYRNNESAVPLADILDREGVPFSGDVGTSFFGYPVVKDIVCTLKLAVNPRDIEAFREIYYKLGLYTAKSQFAQIKEEIDRFEQGTIFEILARNEGRHNISGQALEFGKALRKIGRLRPFDALRAVDELFYRSWIKRKAAEGGDSVRSIELKLDILRALASEHDTVDGYLGRIERLKSMGSDVPTEKRSEFAASDGRGQSGGILLSTIHSSKGMEFDKVVMIDVFQGILPSENSTGASQIPEADRYEEEVRLFYVALTRARDEIEVITAPKRFGKRIEPSPFTAALFEKSEGSVKTGRGSDEKRDANNKTRSASQRYGEYFGETEEDKYRPGTRLVHKFFGAGTIINRTGDILTIRFDGEGDKKMLLSGCLKWDYIKLCD